MKYNAHFLSEYLMKRILYSWSIILLLFLTSCSPSGRLAYTDMSSAYTEDSLSFNPGMRVFSYTSDSATVFIKLDPAVLRGNSNSGSNDFIVHYQVFTHGTIPELLDSATVQFKDIPAPVSGSELCTEFRVKNGMAKKGFIVLNFFKTDKKSGYTRVITFNRNSTNSPDNFLATDEQELPHFSDFYSKDETFSLRYNVKDATQLFVRYYKREFPIAKPPFITEKDLFFSFRPDSLFTIPLNYGFSSKLALDKPGIYHFQSDTSQKEGLTIYRFDDDFPWISNAQSAVGPLRYLTTQKEWMTLTGYRDKKEAVDSFWLSLASGKEEQAKKMIMKYYSRVQTANLLFTSYQEGWKTDRGMIYIIFGPPSFSSFDGRIEEWIYGERGNPYSIEFNFVNVDNYLTKNDFSLIKSSVYKQAWYIAIENWRK